jgi:opacity protein-like surface antigen
LIIPDVVQGCSFFYLFNYFKMEKTMKKLLLLNLIIIFSFATIAYSGQGPYISSNIGLGTTSDSSVTNSTPPGLTLKIESESGLALGIAAGYDFGNNTRIEGEIAYQKNDLDGASLPGVSAYSMGDNSCLSFLANGFYDFKNETRFITSIGAGVGIAKVAINDFNAPGGIPDLNGEDTVFAYQIGGGVGYAVTKKVIIDLKYRYFGTLDPDFGATTTEYSTHNIYLGIRVSY